jgi:signal peptidase I
MGSTQPVSSIVFAPTARPPRSRRVATKLAALAAWGLSGFGVVFATFVSAPGVLGLDSFSILSGSMEPTLMVGDMVVDRRVRASAIRPGDIVTFRDPDDDSRLLTHRVIRYRVRNSTAYVMTKGDANHGVEHWSIPLEGTVGRVEFRLPRLGYALMRMGGRAGRLALIAIPALLLGLFELKRLWFPKERRDEG